MREEGGCKEGVREEGGVRDEDERGRRCEGGGVRERGYSVHGGHVAH